MAQSLGDLFVRLKFDGSEFNKGIMSSFKPIQWLEDKITSTNAKLVGLTALLTGGAVSVGIAELTRQMAGQIQMLGNLSDTLGIAVGDLNALDLGAKKANVSFESVTNGITFFEKTLARAAAGDKQLNRLFDALDLNSDVLNEMAPVDAIKSVSEALNGLENSTDRVLATSILFGRNAAKSILPFLKDGAEGIDEMVRRSDELNGAFSRVDAQMISNASAKVSELTAQFKNFAGQIAVAVSPYVEALIGKFVDFGMKAPKAIDLVTWAIDKLVIGIGYIGDAFQLVERAFLATEVVIMTGVRSFISHLDEFRKSIESWAQKIPGLGDVFKFNDLSGDLKSLDKAIDTVTRELMKSMTEPWKHNEWIDNIRKIREEARLTAEQQVADNDMVGNSLDDIFKKQEKQKDLLSTQKFEQVSGREAAAYLANVARGTAFNVVARGPGDLGKTQLVSDPESKLQTRILQEIADNTDEPVATAA